MAEGGSPGKEETKWESALKSYQQSISEISCGRRETSRKFYERRDLVQKISVLRAGPSVTGRDAINRCFEFLSLAAQIFPKRRPSHQKSPARRSSIFLFSSVLIVFQILYIYTYNSNI